MLTYRNDVPVSVYGFDDIYVRVAYRSRHIVLFPYDFFIDNLERIISLPLLCALDIPESMFIGQNDSVDIY